MKQITYITKEDLDLWIQITNQPKDILFDKVLELAQKYCNSNGELENDMILESYKKSIGIDYYIPNTNTKENLLSFGSSEDELISVEILDADI